MPLSDSMTAKWLAFDAFSLSELYALLKLRQDVFILEQESFYADIDGKDPDALHYMITDRAASGLLGAIRLFVEAGENTARIGRVVIAPEARGTGLGRSLMQAGIDKAQELAPGCGIHVSAQAYLEKFYGSLGFRTVSEVYIEDGIPHIDMIRP
ncbi:GNAT family N-acetyltransferase [Roseibium sediminicola]|uniref:GNAT family N-acetyltransferase n=1 Tax=Roseibium sediminicola TaxID=2933272 RepID=A0ABT0GVN0_9HYPH|nr:GNAT family N-acetyltransferase [Roseibium sp. CAU 1639]MCK7613509.1 GNAT family N-acetyltransferase [Roseibium sp. CAU 1639]